MSPAEGSANIGQWCKKTECWDSVKNIDVSSFENVALNEFALEKEEASYIKREARSNQEIDSSFRMQEVVLKVNSKLWEKIREYELELSLSQTEHSILESMTNGKITLPSPKQAKVLYNILENANSKNIKI